jgi:excisionase family DNA binding protein
VENITKPMDSDRLLLRPDEAAHAMGLGRSKFFEMLAKGEIRSVKHGRNRLVPVEALREWIAKQLEESAA